ncbi:unnamed protein product, partial [marine sediment metagenome]
QDHPDDIPYPGGPPKPPYDNAGYTLTYAMGIEFDRILDGFDGPFEKVEDLLPPPKGQVSGKGSGYLLSHEVNDAFIAVNRLVGSGEEVYWLESPFTVKDKTYPTGTLYIRKKRTTASKLQKMSEEIGLSFEATGSKPRGEALRLKPVRIGLWDRYGGSMPSGWIRWMFEQFEFPFEVVYPQTLDGANLTEKYDVIVFAGGAIPMEDPEKPPELPENLPDEYKDRAGSVTVAKTVPQLRQFLEAGGTVITIGSSTNLAYHLDLPIANALVEKTPEGEEKPLPPEKYFVPGSILQ